MYTTEQAEYVTQVYLKSGKDNSIIPELAKEIGKTSRSVIGKLSREGVYEKTVYLNKMGAAPVTKKELVHKIATALSMEVDSIAGLEKSPKADLQNLWKHLNSLGPFSNS